MKVYFHDPALPNGYEISLTGLNAVLVNGKEVELDPETVHAYEAATGRKLVDATKGTKFSKKSHDKEGN